MARRSVPAAKNRREPKSLVWAQGLLCGAVVTLASPTALLVGVLFLPVLIACALDHQPGKPITRCMALFGLCGIVHPVLRLWADGHTMHVAIVLAADVENLLFSWGGAAIGWVLAELIPVAILALLEAMAQAQIIRLRSERSRLEAEWGFSPTGPASHVLD